MTARASDPAACRGPGAVAIWAVSGIAAELPPAIPACQTSSRFRGGETMTTYGNGVKVTAARPPLPLGAAFRTPGHTAVRIGCSSTTTHRCGKEQPASA